jgi:hypothetical protein
MATTSRLSGTKVTAPPSVRTVRKRSAVAVPEVGSQIRPLWSRLAARLEEMELRGQ